MYSMGTGPSYPLFVDDIEYAEYAGTKDHQPPSVTANLRTLNDERSCKQACGAERLAAMSCASIGSLSTMHLYKFGRLDFAVELPQVSDEAEHMAYSSRLAMETRIDMASEQSQLPLEQTRELMYGSDCRLWRERLFRFIQMDETKL